MPRIRSIKPEFWSDYPTARLSRDGRMLFVALWNFADEHGRLAGDPRFVKGQVFPYDDDLSPDAVEALLDELHDAGNIVRYEVDGAPYIHLPTLRVHQRLEPQKVPSRHPEPPLTPGPGGRHGRSERGADQSGPNVDAQAVENGGAGTSKESSQVSAPSENGADESAQGSDESALLYVAGSMEHAAAAARESQTAAQRSASLPPTVAILRSRLNTRRLVVRWDRLNADHLAEIEQLVETHGDERLVQTALQAFQPNDPPVFAQAWLENWRALPAPGNHLHAAPEPACPEPGHSGTTRHCVQCASEQKAAQ